jgi:8-amino-7-oxononanoate synthase
LYRTSFLFTFEPMIINHLPSRTITVDDAEYLFFSGTSYLGMGHQPAFKQALMDGMDQYGTVFSASRNNNLQIDIYDQAEAFLSQWTGSDAALTVTSGLLAGQLLVQSLPRDTFFIYAPSTHPAIWYPNIKQTTLDTPPQSCFQLDGAFAPYFFQNHADFSSKITDIMAQEERPIAICSNSIDPLTCEAYNFDWLSQLPDNKVITLIFDDSHGIGITHDDGGGFFRFLRKKYPSIFKKKNIKIAVIASMAKALGIPSGVILSDADMIQTIRRNPLFVGASPAVPAYLYAFLNSQNVYIEARKTLQSNIDMFNHFLEKTTFLQEDIKILPNYPVFFSKNKAIYPSLFLEKIFISNFAYPNPTSPPITRIIISALHTEGDILNLTKALSKTHKFL